MNSTAILNLIAKNDSFILFEKAVPTGKLKHELITLVTHDGKSQGFNEQGYRTDQFQLPRPIFDDFLVASLIEKDRPEDSDGRIFYRLTKDGQARGLNAS